MFAVETSDSLMCGSRTRVKKKHFTDVKHSSVSPPIAYVRLRGCGFTACALRHTAAFYDSPLEHACHIQLVFYDNITRRQLSFAFSDVFYN